MACCAAYLDGTTTNRQEVIDSFRSGQADVFLISLKAGLWPDPTEADYVFLLTRGGTRRPRRRRWTGPTDRPDASVMVYRLVATGTIEEKVMWSSRPERPSCSPRPEGGADEALAAEAGGRARLTVRTSVSSWRAERDRGASIWRVWPGDGSTVRAALVHLPGVVS